MIFDCRTLRCFSLHNTVSGARKSQWPHYFFLTFFCFFEFYYFSTCCQRFYFTVFVCVNKPDRVVKWHFFNFSVTDTFFFFEMTKPRRQQFDENTRVYRHREVFSYFWEKKCNVCVNLNSKLRFIIIFCLILQKSNDSMKKNPHEHEEKHCGKIISHFYF